MPVGFTLAESFLQNGLERLVDGLYLSIFLGVVRGGMTILKPQLGCYLFHHFILKVASMISDNITLDSKLSYNLIEYEEDKKFSIIINYRHGLGPLSKVLYDHDIVLMPPSRSWVAINEIYPPLGEGTNDNDWVKRGWVRVHFLSEHLVGVTLLNHFYIIFKYSRPEITDSQDFLGCRKPG